MELEQLVKSSWSAGDGGPGRKYFTLTTRGRGELAHRAQLWGRFVDGTWRVVPRPQEVT